MSGVLRSCKLSRCGTLADISARLCCAGWATTPTTAPNSIAEGVLARRTAIAGVGWPEPKYEKLMLATLACERCLITSPIIRPYFYLIFACHAIAVLALGHGPLQHNWPVT